MWVRGLLVRPLKRKGGVYMSLRKVLNEAVFKRGNTKYMARSGKYYSYDAQGKRTEISRDEYEAALGPRVSGRPDVGAKAQNKHSVALSIDGRKYSASVDGMTGKDLATHIQKIAKHSPGRAIQWLKKNGKITKKKAGKKAVPKKTKQEVPTKTIDETYDMVGDVKYYSGDPEGFAEHNTGDWDIPEDAESVVYMYDYDEGKAEAHEEVWVVRGGKVELVGVNSAYGPQGEEDMSPEELATSLEGIAQRSSKRYKDVFES